VIDESVGMISAFAATVIAPSAMNPKIYFLISVVKLRTRFLFVLNRKVNQILKIIAIPVALNENQRNLRGYKREIIKAMLALLMGLQSLQIEHL
jgi:hypothetical protein